MIPATRRPWIITREHEESYPNITGDRRGSSTHNPYICYFSHPHYLTNEAFEANALLIVKAVNCHDELVEAVKELIPVQGCIQCQELFMHYGIHGDINKTLKRAIQVLAKVQEGK
jgi:hypothetical protein